MPITINTNPNAMFAQRHLARTNLKIRTALASIASGMRITRAADDAAGLAISEKLRSQVRGMGQASRNAQDGISMVQTAEGALAETHSILQRQRELAVQAGNSSLSASDRTAIGEELLALKNEIDRIGAAISNNVVAAVDVSGADAGATYTFTYAAGTNALTLTNATTSVAETITFATAGAAGDKLLSFSTLGVSVTLTGPAEAAADDLGNALAAAGTNDVVTAAGSAAASFQVGADPGQTIAVSFTDMRATAIGSGAGNQLSDKIADNQAVSTTAKADALITVIDDAIADVSAQRGALGAVQNRMESTINALGVSVENLSAAEGRIRDADIAAVSSDLVMAQILQQAGISVLAQANQAPSIILSLLQ